MVFSNILVPYDRSEASRRALAKAAALAADHAETKLTVLNIVKVPDFDSPEFRMMAEASGGRNLSEAQMETIVKRFNDQVMKDLKADLKEVVGDLDLPISIDLMQGESIIGSIVKHAQEMGADLIVMGSRGLGGLRGVLGSVSYGVLRSADAPVLIVK